MKHELIICARYKIHDYIINDKAVFDITGLMSQVIFTHTRTDNRVYIFN